METALPECKLSITSAGLIPDYDRSHTTADTTRRCNPDWVIRRIAEVQGITVHLNQNPANAPRSFGSGSPAMTNWVIKRRLRAAHTVCRIRHHEFATWREFLLTAAPLSPFMEDSETQSCPRVAKCRVSRWLRAACMHRGIYFGQEAVSYVFRMTHSRLVHRVSSLKLLPIMLRAVLVILS